MCKPYKNINIKLMTNDTNEKNSNELLIIISNKKNNSLIIKFKKDGDCEISKYENSILAKINNKNNRNISNIFNNFISSNKNI
jgi:hypothetical protein